jgi:hypothetical protein
MRRKLTFVPAGHEYREWQRPRVRSRIICFFFDPAKMPVHSDASATAAPLVARVFFENSVLWETAVKLAIAVEDAQLETANARLVLAGRELHRAEVLAAKAFGTEQTVDQRTADQRTGQVAVDDANAQIRDAEFDLEHCRITAFFTGRIGTHLVSVGNLIAGSRTATSPTTLLTALVSRERRHC